LATIIWKWSEYHPSIKDLDLGDWGVILTP
jgi:hypothetical protein